MRPIKSGPLTNQEIEELDAFLILVSVDSQTVWRPFLALRLFTPKVRSRRPALNREVRRACGLPPIQWKRLHHQRSFTHFGDDFWRPVSAPKNSVPGSRG